MLLATLFVPALSRSQNNPPVKPGPPPKPPIDRATKYDRTEQGLLTQLQLILTNAKDPEIAKLLVEELQMPKYDQYFQTIYRPDVEPFWEGSYTRALMGAVTEFQPVFARLGAQQGEFKIRRINDAPASKLEQALVAKTTGPVDIYAVNWRKRGAKDDSQDELLGYYAYLSGRYHWFYMLGFPKTQAQATKEATKATPKPAAGATKTKSSGTAGATAGKAPHSAPSTPPAPQQ